jgi:hypothetical protein
MDRDLARNPLAVGLARGAVFVPSRPELAAITRQLGRPKDLLGPGC